MAIFKHPVIGRLCLSLRLKFSAVWRDCGVGCVACTMWTSRVRAQLLLGKPIEMELQGDGARPLLSCVWAFWSLYFEFGFQGVGD